MMTRSRSLQRPLPATRPSDPADLLARPPQTRCAPVPLRMKLILSAIRYVRSDADAL